MDLSYTNMLLITSDLSYGMQSYTATSGCKCTEQPADTDWDTMDLACTIMGLRMSNISYVMHSYTAAL